MATLLFGLARGVSKHIHDSHNRDNHSSNAPQQTTIMTLRPSPYNPEYGAPAHVPRDEPPPPYTEVAPPEARIPQPPTQSRTPTRNPSQAQARREQIPLSRTSSQSQSQPQAPARAPSQSQPRQEPMRPPTRKPSQASPPPTRAPSQSQLQRSGSTIRHDTNMPTYQQPPSQEPASYVVVDAAPGLGVCDCTYRDGFGLAPKCRKCERQARRGCSGTGERRRRRHREGPIHALLAETRR